MPPDLALLSTLIGSNYPCLELIFMVPKVFEPLKFDCTLTTICISGVNPETIRGSNTGVFVGAQSSESQTAWCMSNADVHLGYILTGSAMSMFSNRLSFALDLKG